MGEYIELGSENKKPAGRTGHITVSYGKYMLVWGGYKENPINEENTYFCGSEIWIYSCDTERWYLKECLEPGFPQGMSGSTGVIIDDALYLFGGYGYDGHGCTNSMYKLDLSTFHWELLNPSGSPPIAVDKMVGWQYKDNFYVFGGFGNPDPGPENDFDFIFYHVLWRGWTNQFFKYDPRKNKWSKPPYKGDLPCARAAHAAAVLDGKVYIFGGRHNFMRMNDLHCLDMETLHWSGEITMAEPVPKGRSWHTLTALSKRYLLLYGGFGQCNEPFSDCWLFDTKMKSWRELDLPFEKPRLWHGACLNSYNEILIFGGCTTNILDHLRTPEQADDVLVIRFEPKSLFRLCVDRVFDMPDLQDCWNSLPCNLKTLFLLKTGNLPLRNLAGS